MSDEELIDLFLCGKVPDFNHAKHVQVAKLLKQRPHGRELMHLGLQITAIRKGVPEKYSREITDACWEAIR